MLANLRVSVRSLHVSWLTLGALFIGALVMAPVVSVVLAALAPDKGSIAHLASTTLPDCILNTAVLVIGVGLGTMIIGTGTAWLVTMCSFPGRGFFEWALIVPLAMPAYIIAYAYTDFLSHPGPVQTLLRDLTGWGPRDYWFPNVRSVGGAVTMFVFVFYPYVYLMARTAFLQQSSCHLAASRVLGASAWSTFWSVALPLARPAIAGGLTLALMETLADFGAVSHFAVQTFTTGIYRALISMYDTVAAAQLSVMLLGFVVVILAVERLERSRARYASGVTRELPRYHMRGAAAWGAVLACTLPVLLGFLLPTVILLHLSWMDGHEIISDRYLHLTLNSVTLAALAAFAVTIFAFALCYAARAQHGPLTRFVSQFSRLGYAVPGTVIAIGIIVPMATMDNAIDSLLRETLGISPGLLLTGSIAALIFAYVVRFLAVGLNGIEAGFEKVPLRYDEVARTLGRKRLSVVPSIHFPLLRGPFLAVMLLVFVDVMKELPATLILRPFNYDTLAIQAYRLASDERLAQASTPSLILVMAGLLPVILISRRIRSSVRTPAPG